MKEKKLPKIIQQVGFDFDWDEEKVWVLDVVVEEMNISDLEWHFDIPFWRKQGGFYNLSPNQVLAKSNKYKDEFERMMQADLKYPLDIMFWKHKWLLLDGLHRLVKAKYLGMEKVQVRKIPLEAIPLIKK